MLSRIKKILTGLSVPQEYVCTSLEDFRESLTVTLTYSGIKTFRDVTQEHLFLGYKPLIIGLVVEATYALDQSLREAPMICLCFHRKPFEGNSTWEGFAIDKQSVAKLKLKKLNQEIECGEKRVLFYEGVKGEHNFLTEFNKFMNRQRDNFKKRSPVNINLQGNLRDQIQIAYAVPRIISVISLAHGEMINLFPTDLHGPVGDRFYMSSLRLGGKANEQVEQLKRIVISEVDVSRFKDVYGLGKNHMRDLSEQANFSIHRELSESFRLPLPRAVLRYRELVRLNSFDWGIHRIHTYEVMGKHSFEGKSTLSHIHQYYAQWRKDRGILTQMLLR